MCFWRLCVFPVVISVFILILVLCFPNHCMRVKVINIRPVEETVSSSNIELIYRKAVAIDETGNMPVAFYGEITSFPNDNNIY